MLLFVDLGYNGSVQNYVEPLLRRELGVDIAGRYLLLREKEISACAKQGFFDTRHFDEKALEALTTNVAVLEQLRNTTMGSVLDRSEERRVGKGCVSTCRSQWSPNN